MKKKIYNRQYLRKHFATGVYISNDGEHAERDYFEKNTNNTKVHVYTIYRDESGRSYIKTVKDGKLYLDILVLTCYRGQEPKDGKTYFPFHKDGDMKNSYVSNLEWREETPESLAEQAIIEMKAWYKNRKITANKKGLIKQGSKNLPFVDYIYDSDLDWTYHYPHPWVRYEEKNRWGGYATQKIDADKVFEDLGLVNGDKSKFPHPVILHCNNDYMDYSFGNLEWCDASDQRYKDFDKIRHNMVMKKDHDVNYRLDERSWNVIYRGCEPYQDWTDRPEKKLYKIN